MVVELGRETLDPTGRSIDVGIEANGIRTAAGGRFAVTTSPPDPAGGSDIVFGDLDDARILRTVHIDSWGPRANFNADGSRYAAGGEDGRLYIIDVATGALAGLRRPVHSGPISWVTFSPDGKTLASMGFDGDLILSDAATAIPYAHVQPGPANTRRGWLPPGRPHRARRLPRRSRHRLRDRERGVDNRGLPHRRSEPQPGRVARRLR